MVKFVSELQEEVRNKLDAISEASVLRLRPVMMTTVATVADHTLPIVAAGAEARNSIGILLVLGMTIGTMFTLFVLPSIYMLIAKNHQRERDAPAALEAGS